MSEALRTAEADELRMTRDDWQTEAANSSCRSILEGQAVPHTPQASRELEQLAVTAGLSNPQFLLGAIYLTGWCGEEDMLKAATMFKHAANRGHTIAQVCLSHMYFYGRGIPQSFNEALYWATIAARWTFAPFCSDIRGIVASYVSHADVAKITELAEAWQPIDAADSPLVPKTIH